jgi:sulfur-oxidizing protein SoxY
MSRPFSPRSGIEFSGIGFSGIEPNRRAVIGAGAGLITAFALRPARASTELADAIRAFTGGVEPKPGKVTLDIAPLVENGNAVGVEVKVDHPMQPGNFVSQIALFTEKNPAPEVAVFHLSPHAGRAHVVTRMRLATSQNVAAVARLSDGSLWQETREVIVTIAACTEE